MTGRMPMSLDKPLKELSSLPHLALTDKMAVEHKKIIDSLTDAQKGDRDRHESELLSELRELEKRVSVIKADLNKLQRLRTVV